jgi:hypothetical protein
MTNEFKKSAKNSGDALKILWEENFFRNWQSIDTISKELGNRGNNFSSTEICGALIRAKKFLTRRGKRGFFEYIQKINITNKEIEKIENELFSDELINKLDKDFKYEIEDLKLNFGRSGNCTAFLLRKILEKLIYITFAKYNLISQLEDKTKEGKLIGLGAMINVATSEKIKGIPFLLSKTGKEIQGIKFLGDTSAHNPLIEVDMKTIIPQMPYIITAYKELAIKL